jgi:hypothetical protein
MHHARLHLLLERGAAVRNSDRKHRKQRSARARPVAPTLIPRGPIKLLGPPNAYPQPAPTGQAPEVYATRCLHVPPEMYRRVTLDLRWFSLSDRSVANSPRNAAPDTALSVERHGLPGFYLRLLGTNDGHVDPDITWPRVIHKPPHQQHRRDFPFQASYSGVYEAVPPESPSSP